MYNRDDIIAEARREDEAYRAAVAALTPAQRAAWAAVEESYEWFDGESAIAHGTLNAYLRRGDLD